MYKVKTGGIYRHLLPNWQASEIAKIVLRANRLREAQRILGQFLERCRALRIHREPGRMIVISANRNLRLLSDPLDNLVRAGPVIDHISNAPKFVEITLGQCIQSSKVAMNIGDDDDLQESSAARKYACATFGGEIYCRRISASRPLPGEFSPGVIICPSTLIRKGKNSG